jgi:hypothetical protein
MHILGIGSDPSRNGLLRVWGGSVSRSRKRSEARGGGRTWWVLVGGEGAGEDPAKGGAARPVVATRKEKPRV